MAVQGLSLNTDVFAYAMSFVDVSDVCHCATVCKLWKQFSENPDIWKGLFGSQGIPMVSQKEGPRNYREDFLTLYSATTVSGAVFRKFFGEPIGDVPCIPREIFDSLSQPDPFEPEKLQKETFELVVEYPSILRALGAATPLALDALGYLVNAPRKNGETYARIPFSLTNRIQLCLYPLKGNENLRVFGFINPLVLSQCDYCPAKVNVYYQRRKSVLAIKGRPYSEQKRFVESKNFHVMPLGSIALSEAVHVLQSGQQRPYVFTSNSVYDEDLLEQQSSIGNTAGVKGVFINIRLQYSQMGVIAGTLL